LGEQLQPALRNADSIKTAGRGDRAMRSGRGVSAEHIRMRRAPAPVRLGTMTGINRGSMTPGVRGTTARRCSPPCAVAGFVCVVLASLLAPGAAAPQPAAGEPAVLSLASRNFTRAEPLEALSAGAATSRKPVDSEAFSWPSASMRFAAHQDFYLGNGVFSRRWRSAADGPQVGAGLGPLYSATGCRGCHFRDGRGHPPGGAGNGQGTLVAHLSIAPRDASERQDLAAHRRATIPEPVYGAQLQEHALAGQRPEGKLGVDYREITVTFADGTSVQLRDPRYVLTDLAYGELNARAQLSPRVAPPMIGLGLLEAVAESSIAARADPDDSDANGISGRVNRVWSVAEQRVMLGRFGWKAGKATIADQAAGALTQDLGISSPLNGAAWGDCTAVQSTCRRGPHGADGARPELAPESFDDLVFYSRNLAVPARRGENDAGVLRGKALFYASGCHACHAPRLETRADWPLPALAGQVIHPYTDLLLHDMGEGLSDHRQEGEASGREWRTAPLWGIGLTETVSGHTFFLHDGRARNLMEAILWHGGEARASRDAVRGMNADERQRLLSFLNSL
jgi:CxxC motif-containing protein (DUF1111 family)